MPGGFNNQDQNEVDSLAIIDDENHNERIECITTIFAISFQLPFVTDRLSRVAMTIGKKI